MADRPEPPPDWIPLGAASQLLGVDPATLRRWATAGRVESYKTPGGHRRFSRAVVERVQASRTPARRRISAKARPERVAAAYSRRILGPTTPIPASWVAGLDPAVRDSFRERGLRMVNLLVSILDRPDPAAKGASGSPGEAHTVGEIDVLARQQGADTASLGLPLVDALNVVLATRQPLLAELAAQAGRRRLAAGETAALVTRGGTLLNRYLLAYVEGFQSVGEQPAAGIAPPVAGFTPPAAGTKEARPAAGRPAAGQAPGIRSRP